RRLKRASCLDEERAPLDHVAAQLTPWWPVAHGGDMRAGRKPCATQHRIGSVGAETDDIGVAYRFLNRLNGARTLVAFGQMLRMCERPRCETNLAKVTYTRNQLQVRR